MKIKVLSAIIVVVMILWLFAPVVYGWFHMM